MASKYYNSSGKEVNDGDIAYADDLNTINQAIDSGFQLADTDISAAIANVSFYATAASNSADAAAADAIQTAADRVQTGLDRTSATNSAASATSSESNASTSASNASASEALAEKWAEEIENTPVEVGKYSAKHWAAKAAAGAGVQTVTGTGVNNTDPNNPVITITKSTISLGNVDNTSDTNKPISTLTQTALDLKAPVDSPVFTTSARGPTPAASDDSDKIATTAHIKDAMPSSVGANGYQVFPSSTPGKSVIIQWGSLTSNSTPNQPSPVTWPIAFAVAPYSVILTANNLTTDAAFAWGGQVTDIGMNAKCSLASTTVYYIAIGYVVPA